jgi:hypothetical protein
MGGAIGQAGGAMGGALGMPGAGGMAPPGGMAGAKGQIRNPIMVTLICMFCFPYMTYWFYFQVLPELKQYLGKSDQEVNPMKDLILAIVTCGIWFILTVMKTGKLVQEAQMRSGRPNPEDKSTLFLIVAFVFSPALPFLMQTELNKAWDPSLN